MRTLLRAGLTGAFCLVFALVVDQLADALTLLPVAAISFVSGFCGSLFASLVLRKDAA